MLSGAGTTGTIDREQPDRPERDRHGAARQRRRRHRHLRRQPNHDRRPERHAEPDRRQYRSPASMCRPASGTRSCSTRSLRTAAWHRSRRYRRDAERCRRRRYRAEQPAELPGADGGMPAACRSRSTARRTRRYRIELLRQHRVRRLGQRRSRDAVSARRRVTTSGTGTIAPTLFQLPGGSFVTASATDPGNNTSELAACVLTGVPPSLAAPSPASANRARRSNVALTGQNTTWSQGRAVAGFGSGHHGQLC